MTLSLSMGGGWEAATIPIPEAWDTKEMRKTRRNHLTLKGLPGEGRQKGTELLGC